MAGRIFIDLVTDAEEITQVRGIRAVVKRLANDSLAYICGISEWPFLWTTHWFQTIAPYETGTVTATDTSKTVTGASTTFTSAMVGRKIRFEDETAYYTIAAYVSATEITLDQPYSGTGGSGLEYSIFKDEYMLRADLDQQKKIRQSDNGYALFSLSASDLDDNYPANQGYGDPAFDVYTGRAVKTYSTGTITLTSGDRTLTGSGTSWLSAEGVSKGTKIKIGSSIYTVNTVDSDTLIELYEAPTANVSAGTSYTAILDNAVVQLGVSIPDSVQTYYYRFQRIPAVMDADNDVPDMPHSMHPLILLRMLPTLWRHRGNIDRAVSDEASFERELNKWIAHYALPVLDRSYPIKPFSSWNRGWEARWPSGTGIPLWR